MGCARGSKLGARVVLLCACPSEVRAQGVGALRARLLARRLSRNELAARLGGLRANLFGARAMLANSAGGAKRFAGARMRLARGRLKLAGGVIQGNGGVAGVARGWMGAVGDAACGAAGVERVVQGAGCVVSEALGLAPRWIDLGVGARVGCGASNGLTQGVGMLGSRWGRWCFVGVAAVPYFSGCLIRSWDTHAQGKKMQIRRLPR